MELNLPFWIAALDHYTHSRVMEGCALMFPLLDKAAKRRRPKDNNKIRMSKFIVDELEHVIALGTGLDLQFNPNGKKIVFDSESIGEVLYRLRCSVLHEVEMPDNIVFSRTPGVFTFAWEPATKTTPSKITMPEQFCELLLLVILGCPEFNSVPAAYIGRRIRFNTSEILPSECVGKFGVLRHQLLFGSKKAN